MRKKVRRNQPTKADDDGDGVTDGDELAHGDEPEQDRQ